MPEMLSDIEVTLADAPTDVLVYLVDHGPTYLEDLVRAVVPVDADTPNATVARACTLLREIGYMTDATVPTASVEGVAAVEHARGQIGDADPSDFTITEEGK